MMLRNGNEEKIKIREYQTSGTLEKAPTSPKRAMHGNDDMEDYLHKIKQYV
jgi:hypothetical protein